MKTIVIFIKSMAASGGIERVIANLIQIWHLKYHVILLVKDIEKKSFYELPDDIEIISIEEPLILNMKNRFQRIVAVLSNFIKSHYKLKKLLSKIDFDYIYTTTSLNGLEVFMLNRDYRKKMVVSEHASAFAVNSIYQRIKKFLYPKVYCVSVPNKMDCEIYKKWGCNTKYIPHLVTYQAKEGNRLDTKIAINVGRLTGDKRQKDLIEIWSKVENLNGWELWIVGSGEEQQNLEQAICDFKVQDSVKMIPHTSKIQEIYKQASLFLFTSRMEGFGMVLLEAMAFGIPCISYDCPSGPRDVIRNGINGVLIENGNKDEFVSAINNYISAPAELINRYGINALETVAKWNNAEIARQWDELFGL